MRGKVGRIMQPKSPSIGFVISKLAERNMLPAIYFIFSRRGCDKAIENIKDLTLVPKNIDGKGTIGAQLQPNIKKETKKTKNIFELFKYTNNEFSSLLVKTIQGYKGLITNFSSTAQQLSGPVKIVEIGAQLSQQGGTGILLFAALISINLAVLNSLPLPLLDGGQLVFTLIEGFRGKPVPVKVQMVVTQSSFFLLVGLSVLLIIRDTSQLLIVQRLLNQ